MEANEFTHGEYSLKNEQRREAEESGQRGRKMTAIASCTRGASAVQDKRTGNY